MVSRVGKRFFTSGSCLQAGPWPIFIWSLSCVNSCYIFKELNTITTTITTTRRQEQHGTWQSLKYLLSIPLQESLLTLVLDYFTHAFAIYRQSPLFELLEFLHETNRHVLTALEAGSPRSRCSQGRCLVWPVFLVCKWPASCYVLTWSFFCECIEKRDLWCLFLIL